MVKIVLTADRAVFSDYNGADFFGFGLCLPYRFVPSFIEYKVLAPPIPIGKDGRAKFAPYQLAKVEASLLSFGFNKDDVIIVPPEHVGRVVDKDTYVLGVSVLDPQGLAPVSWTLKTLTGGGKTCTQYEFEEFMKKVKKLKEKYRFKVVVGGPGVWQLRGLEKKFGIDVIYDGEPELLFPIIVNKIINGEEVPNYIHADPVPIESIPPIVTPSRNGLIQITRGCPRRCQFCSPTMFKFRSIPLDIILKEVEVTLRGGVRCLGFVTEDVFLYGAYGLSVNGDAVKKLFIETHSIAKKYGVTKVGFTHATTSSALIDKSITKFISDINNLSKENPLFPQVGMESGSPRIVGMYFRGKPYPWKPEDWPKVVVEATKLFNDNYWYPCYTYIVGFPNETEDDVMKTIELLHTLKDEGFRGWTFPLLLVPIGNTLIENRVGFKYVKDLSKSMIEAIVVGWRISLDFSREAYKYLISNVKSSMLKKFIDIVASKTFDILEMWVKSLEKSIDVVEEYSKVNIRSASKLTYAIISNILRRKLK